ncbi:hypothetical protein U9M48_038197 [Paspalum notatum var. saurae]|uniref:Pectinesterase inhibitor domain-containing protein n=1 Tax=Paspalum notatum var. saurae TaxID=547442 RepID=A0AAQ3UIS7_PASNO
MAFLRARCATTLYGVACYESLLPYACVFQTSHVKLARAATDVNAASLRRISKRVKEIIAAHGGGGGAGGGSITGGEMAALRDCASTLSSAAGLAKQSAAELAKLDAAGAAADRSKIRWAISNTQTWLSASMTNEATCSDGLALSGATASASLTVRQVAIGVVSAKEHTSIALALVNGIPVPS